MSKTIEIERKLISINGDIFGGFCDEYLCLQKSIEFTTFSAPGNMPGKDKSTKGTPDAYYIRPNGKYVLAQYTTKEKKEDNNAFFTKLESDVLKCLDKAKTGLDIEQVERIILCYTADLDTAGTNKITNLCKNYGVEVEFHGISILKIEIRKSPTLQKSLGLKIDTFQILTPQEFIKENELSTFEFPIRLSHSLINRDIELEEIQNIFQNNINKSLSNEVKAEKDIIILGGPQGVGKTRLALEVIKNFSKTNTSYTAYCISDKHQPIYDDLHIYLDPEKDYILLIDDANRQLDNLIATLSLLMEGRTGKIKILITVRDHSIDLIKNQTFGYNVFTKKIDKFSNEQVTKIISVEPFEILNYDFQRRINEIAKGNIRLAIMASDIALETKSLESLNNIFDLYDRYFIRAFQEKGFSDNKQLLQHYGIISFFLTLDLCDGMLIKDICNGFEIEENAFIENVFKLERAEVISVFDKEAIKVTDQVFATYIFYKVFVEEKILSLEVLFDIFFQQPNYTYKFRDAIGSLVKSFSAEKIIPELSPTLHNYWVKIKDKDKLSLDFLELFWLYMPDQCFFYINDKIQDNKYLSDKISYGANDFRKYSDEYYRMLKILLEILEYPEQLIKTALPLAIKIVVKRPDFLDDLIKYLSEVFCMSGVDVNSKFYTQQTFLLYFLNKIEKKDIFHRTIFLEILKKFIQPTFVAKFDKSKKRIRENYAPLKVVQDIRAKVWGFLEKELMNNTDTIFEYIKLHIRPNEYSQEELQVIDFPHVKRIILSSLNPNDLLHCFFVQEYVKSCKKIKKINAKDIKVLQEKFVNETFEFYNLLYFDYWNSNKPREQKLFERKKELKKLIKIDNIKSFENFHNKYLLIRELNTINNSDFTGDSFRLVCENISELNPHLGVKYLTYIITNKNKSALYYCDNIFKILFKKGIVTQPLYELINEHNFQFKYNWLQSFFIQLPENEVNQYFLDRLIVFYKSFDKLDEVLFFRDDFLCKFQKLDNNILISVLEIILNRLNGTNKNILLYSVFDKSAEIFAKKPDLFRELFLYKYKVDKHFDHDHEILKLLLFQDADFILKVLALHFKEDSVSTIEKEIRNFGLIWDMLNAEVIAEKSIIFLLRKKDKYSSRNYLKGFFTNIKTDENKKRAIDFLLRFVEKSHNQKIWMDSIVMVVKENFFSYFDELIKTFLIHNSKIEDFKSINWGYTGTILTSFNHNQDEERVKFWGNILSIIEELEDQFAYLYHKEYVSNIIQSYQKYAKNEQKRIFLGNQ